jgi:hypothetical protein
LGESIDLIVVATGKGEQLSDEFLQPSGALRKTNRSTGEQTGPFRRATYRAYFPSRSSPPE